MINYKDALNFCLSNAKPINRTTNIFINEALNRILAQDIYAKRDAPAFTNSAMDGFAFKYSNNKKLKIIKTIYAGDKYKDFEVKENECVKIMTGAKLPSSCDSVIPIENCKVYDGYIEFEEIKKGANVRIKGEEIKKGDLLIKKGTLITPEIIALLVSQGIVNIKVYDTLKIAILATGNELKEPWEEIKESEIYNVNSYSISALLKKFGFESDIIGLSLDSLEEIKKAIKNLQCYDVIITSGGISFSEADFVYKAFIDNNLKPLFHKIAVKPGKPTMAGIMNSSFVFAMPGNPLSAYINTFCLAIPTIKKLSGDNNYYYQTFSAINKSDFKVNPKKDHTILGYYENEEFEVYNSYKYGSAMLTPLTNSNAIFLLNKGKEIIKKNEKIKIIPFNTNFTDKNFMFNDLL